MIPYGRQEITNADIEAVVEVLRSDMITQGPVVPRFEQAVADYCGASHAVAANSGTSALHLACRALDVGPGDTLWTSPITFVASANCALYCGLDVDFVEIDPHTYNISVQALEEKLQEAERSGQLPQVVVPVHMCGQPCEMEAIHGLSEKYGFRIIEDACHAVGARYKGEPVGNCRYSDIAVFSFHPVKLITTGEGGMAVTNNAELADRMALLRNHGITRDQEKFENTGTIEYSSEKAPETSQSSHLHTFLPSYYYEQIDMGYNYRMTDIQAALGLSQLQRLEDYVSRRQKLAERYDLLLADLPVSLPKQHQDSSSAWHLYVIRLQLDRINYSRKRVFEYLREQGVGVNVHYIPVHTQPYYRKMGFEPGMFPEAERYYRKAITLPLFPAMSEEEQDQVVQVFRKSLAHGSH